MMKVCTLLSINLVKSQLRMNIHSRAATLDVFDYCDPSQEIHRQSAYGMLVVEIAQRVARDKGVGTSLCPLINATSQQHLVLLPCVVHAYCDPTSSSRCTCLGASWQGTRNRIHSTHSMDIEG